jgi:hypothetical protein
MLSLRRRDIETNGDMRLALEILGEESIRFDVLVFSLK